ncbi:uncharacterized protein LOC134187949 isoform X2 [Corticium candelabrum]|uniref:uncharacterized protein LOC134187949 isoform X2 n=1 Tax=Corticium candelabrum TaxID=121492 RepID=UPI002E272B37|nr:uncharacterized protein LOC134187949 isoform X2 [Corticium candelabrum]XP_062512110.1 uncharacterized protein LOC134187949 isoform X2 [Corticium candelabrum]
MPGVKLQLGYMWSNPIHIGADSEFVSLNGNYLCAWFPANSEFAVLLEPHMYLAPDTRLLQCEQSKCLAESLPLYAIESTSAISHLLSDTHVDECLQKFVVCKKWMCKSTSATVGKLIERLSAIYRNDEAETQVQESVRRRQSVN